LPWPVARRDRSCWLESIGVLMNLLVAGCRAGRILVFAYPAGVGLPLSFRFNVRPTLSSSARYRARRSGSVEPPVLRMRFRIASTRQADRSTASLEVWFPSAFAGRAALSEAASHRTIPLRRCACRSRLRRRSDYLGPAPSLRFFRLVSTVRPAHAARFKSRFTPARSGSFATVSLSRGVPLPA